jgi:hypothetical protein
VHYVRDNFLPGRTFTDMGDLQLQARQWCDRAKGKIHGTTGERPVEMLAQEHLKPLPNEAILGNTAGNHVRYHERDSSVMMAHCMA